MLRGKQRSGKYNGTVFHDEVIKRKHHWIPIKKASDAEFDVFFGLRLTKRLSKQSWGWRFETPLRSLWRHFIVSVYNGIYLVLLVYSMLNNNIFRYLTLVFIFYVYKCVLAVVSPWRLSILIALYNHLLCAIRCIICRYHTETGQRSPNWFRSFAWIWFAETSIWSSRILIKTQVPLLFIYS